MTEEVHNALSVFLVLSPTPGLNSFLLVRLVPRYVQSFSISK